ncbi:diacylglycerol/lipid kinase family protein [Aquabacter spiritensis]|uniref:Diacylglycerol kinase family enzyme n=1 Tax=Aquabacter spiritensis TaxID=933073 RepID=A0A4V2UXF6_9HYPH|nr:diacylglycerol kinase family protein [Aquabacter spiritensis]TCT03298.1 diacylglycerol kinase family enzyme [Aquabacter spiritensis]
MSKTLVILNAKAGTIADLGAERVRAEVDAALTQPGRDVDVLLCEGAKMAEAIRGAAAQKYDTVIVGAGDGTVSYAASVLCGTDITLGVLPLGTMNLLAYDIGLPRDLPGALVALQGAEPMRIDLATLNDRAFHGVSGIGFFSQMALAREQGRKTSGRVFGWFVALGKAVMRSGRLRLDIEVDGKRVSLDAYAALVTNNCFDGADWHRSRLDAGVLEVHVAEERGAFARVKAGADLLVQSWRGNPGIHSFTAERITINAVHRDRAWVATDGEVTRETMPLRYEIRRDALTLLMPPGAVQWQGKHVPESAA